MTKVISISDDAYDQLSQLKKDLSFSQVIISLTKMCKKDVLLTFAGAFDKSKWKNIKEDLTEDRKISSRRMKL